VKLSEKLLKEAVDSIENIIDPVVKVDAISKILGYVFDHDMDYQSINENPEPEKVSDKIKPEPVSTVMEEPKKVSAETKTEVAEIPLPKEQEKLEEATLRRDLIAKEYGDLTIGTAFSDPKLQQYLRPEIEAIKCFKTVMKSHFPQASQDTIEKMLQYYMLEFVSGSEDCTQMKLSSFLLEFFPYVKDLYVLHQFPEEKVKEAVNAISGNIDTYKDKGMAAVKKTNIKAILLAIKDLTKVTDPF